MAKVIIIDDNPDMLSMLEAVFARRTSHETVLCKDGKGGIEQALSLRPDLALVDVMMPSVDGYEVVRRLRSDPATQDMGIIMLTARGQPVDREAALAAGADAHVTKPVSFDVLEATIADVLTKGAAGPVRRQAVLPVVSLKGGVGRTTVAVNLAVLLQQSTPTILWDFSLASGHAALFLGIQPRTHWGNRIEDPDLPIEALVLEHTSGLKVLCAPPLPPHSGPPTKEQTMGLLEALLEIAGTVVVDMPPLLSPGTMALLKAAERILLLTGDTPPAIQSTLTTLQALQTLASRILLVHNLPDAGRHPRPETLQRVMRAPIHVTLPYDPLQETALGKGMPLALANGDSPFVTALRDGCTRPLMALLT